jgi:hypothetical protein
VFLPIAAVELILGSISIDVAYQFMPRPMKVFCMVPVLAGSAAVYLVLAYISYGDAMRSLRIRAVMMGNVLVSVRISRFVLPVSFVIAGSVCLWQLARLATDAGARARLLASGGATREL